MNKCTFLSKIPLLGELFKNRKNSDIDEDIYVFIRPIIVRNKSFTSLIQISAEEIKNAKIYSSEKLKNPLMGSISKKQRFMNGEK